MIKLYQYEVCPFCCKVRAVLDYKKLPYEKVEVHPLNKKEIAFAKPYQKVPILMDGNQQVIESNDIIQYLDDRYPDKLVFAETEEERQKQRVWLKFADEELVIILPPNIYRSLGESYDSFKYISKMAKFSFIQRQLIRVAGSAVMLMVAKKKMKERGIKDPRAKLKEVLQKLETGLNGKDFLGGKKPDVSDLVCYGVLNSVRELKVWEFIQKENPKTAQWFENVRSQLA